MTVIEAFSICQNHTYFSKPVYNTDGNIIGFTVDFHGACDISPVEHNDEIVWIAEMGSFSLKDKHCYYYNPNLDIIKPTYEELIIAIAELLVDKFGMDLLDDYYFYDEEEPLMIKDGKYFVSNPNSKSGWKVEELLNKIREYEEIGNNDK